MGRPVAVIKYAEYSDGASYNLDIVREDLSGLGLPSRREQWTIIASNDQDARKTVEWHFGLSALWYRLASTAETTGATE